MKRFILLGIILFSVITSIAQSQFIELYPDTLNKKRLKTVIGVEIGSYVSILSFLSIIWYEDNERVPFHYSNDLNMYLQMDKAGHAYSAYHESALAYNALLWAGVDKKKALIYGGPVGWFMQAPMEILDGIYEGWGFSWGDMAANTFGTFLFMSQQALFEDQIIVMKFSYTPSIYPDYHSYLGETEVEKFFSDYNAHTYWLSANLSQILGIENFPKWINIAFGYSANGIIKSFENPICYDNGDPFPHLERYRQFLFSLDIDFTKIPTEKRWLRSVFRAANLIKIPFPTLEYNRIDKFKFRPLYF